jgi:integrase
MASKRRGWTYTAGQYPHSIRVFERGGPGGVIYASIYDGSLRAGKGGEHRLSLGHRDRDEAMAYAEREARKLRQGIAQSRTPIVLRVFDLYEKHRTVSKGERQMKEDGRAATRWRNHLEPDFNLSKLSRREWDQYERIRRSGALSSNGSFVTKLSERRPAGDRTIQRDQVWLRSVCRWACDFRDSGALLLEYDPTRGFPFCRELNPERPIATHDRADRIREHYHVPQMRVEWSGRREYVESWLPEIFEVVVGTGRRISAVCGLRYEDLRLTGSPAAPYGGIVWQADRDKMKKEWTCPISPSVREALESALRKRRAVGPGPLFPKPSNQSVSISKDQTYPWLRKVELLAGLQPQIQGAWHPYRRLWATCRKDLPDVDVAMTGGWSSLEALRQAYQQPDEETMLRVVLHEAELREIR